MAYWAIGLWAAAIHFVTNRDVFWQRSSDMHAPASYRTYLLCVLSYLLVDALWGVFDLAGVMWLKYAATYACFVLMAASVLLWTRYVIDYLGDAREAERKLSIVGQALFVFQLSMLIINFVYPIMFSFDAVGAYHVNVARHLVLIVQIVVFLQSSAFSITRASREEGALRRRHLTIAVFGIAMSFFVGAQVAFPLMPLYALGLALGSSVLHSFILEDELEEGRRELEWALERERSQRQELIQARQLAYTDPLTGLESKAAYVELVDQVDARLRMGDRRPFCVVVFDLNGLKRANDTLGHAAGDELIRQAAQMIRECFGHARTFRIGGDEFLAHLSGPAFKERRASQEQFEAIVDENARCGGVTVSAGYAELEEGDVSCADVFARADAAMYKRKRELEEMGVTLRD